MSWEPGNHFVKFGLYLKVPQSNHTIQSSFFSKSRKGHSLYTVIWKGMELLSVCVWEKHSPEGNGWMCQWHKWLMAENVGGQIWSCTKIQRLALYLVVFGYTCCVTELIILQTLVEQSRFILFLSHSSSMVALSSQQSCKMGWLKDYDWPQNHPVTFIVDQVLIIWFSLVLKTVF